MFDTEKFIEEIEKRPAIYDVNRSEYNDRNAKTTAWDEVCQVMVPNWAGLTDEERNVEGILQPLAIDRSGFLHLHLLDPGTTPRDRTCSRFKFIQILCPGFVSYGSDDSSPTIIPSEKSLRGKWRNIRDYFMKELKLQKSQKLGPAGRKRKKYMYFDQLMFLMPMVENKRNAGNTSGNFKLEESEGEPDNPVIEEYDVPLTHAAPSITTTGASYKMCPRYPKQLCETSLASFDNEIHDILSSNSSQRVAYDEDDYDKMFLLSLVPILRQVPEEKKLDVRIQIQQILAMALRSPDSKQ
ncbi:unnamed protein product [Xylocopa violacea]|uniref:BESS domain-containing protein n=1 Tax=Xylocopa violacea TaxID=135666 RepID=A0ABP1N6V0_XYLVO